MQSIPVSVKVTQPPLQMVVVEVTTWCNLKCPGCTRTHGEAKGSWKNQHMSLDAFRKIVANLPSVKQIVLHGVGEPTMNPHYLDFIRHARASGKFEHIVCITNALARDVEFYKSMVDAGMDSFTVSVDSLTQDVADLTRTGTPVTKLQERLIGFKQHNLPFFVTLVASRINLADISNTLQILNEIGVEIIYIQPYLEFDDQQNGLSDADALALIEQLKTLQATLKGTQIQAPFLERITAPKKTVACSAPWREPAVTVDGYLSPCCVKLASEPLGLMDLTRHSFDTLQSSAEFCAYLNDYCDSLPEYCEGCFYNQRGEENRPLVSVTMVTYNHASFVKEALLSVLAQTYSPLEIIISDDASTDNTADIVDECLANYVGPHRVRFIRQPQNLGARGRNNFLAGYRQSFGKFIIWFCGDDVMHPEQVSRMVETWQRDQVSLVTVNAEYINEHSQLIGRYFREPDAVPNVSVDNLARDGANDCNFGAGMGFSRELIEVFGFDETMPPPQFPPDLIFPFYAGLLAGCAMIATPLLRYRVHGGQTSMSLAHEGSQEAKKKLQLEQAQWQGHLEVAQFLLAKLAQLAAHDPLRFSPSEARLRPLLNQQLDLMAGRLDAVNYQLENLDDEPAAAQPSQQDYEAEVMACLRSNDLLRAAELCNAALAAYPAAAMFWFTLALIFRAAGDVEMSVQMLENALALEPENIEYQQERLSLQSAMTKQDAP